MEKKSGLSWGNLASPVLPPLLIWSQGEGRGGAALPAGGKAEARGGQRAPPAAKGAAKPPREAEAASFLRVCQKADMAVNTTPV